MFRESQVYKVQLVHFTEPSVVNFKQGETKSEKGGRSQSDLLTTDCPVPYPQVIQVQVTPEESRGPCIRDCEACDTGPQPE